MALIPAGTTIFNRTTGELIGCTVAPVLISIRADTTALVDALDRVQATIQLTADAARKFNRALGLPDRLAALRYQAKRKGRPGWRAIPIPKRPRWKMQFTPNHPERSAQPFAPTASIANSPP